MPKFIWRLLLLDAFVLGAGVTAYAGCYFDLAEVRGKVAVVSLRAGADEALSVELRDERGREFLIEKLPNTLAKRDRLRYAPRCCGVRLSMGIQPGSAREQAALSALEAAITGSAGDALSEALTGDFKAAKARVPEALAISQLILFIKSR